MKIPSVDYFYLINPSKLYHVDKSQNPFTSLYIEEMLNSSSLHFILIDILQHQSTFNMVEHV
jgi:hypothetical protein